MSDVVSAMDWQTIGDPLCGYRYQYDALGRLAAADYREGGQPSDRYVTEYSYDLMGNILTLSRSGKVYDKIYGITDDLTYQYDGNRLIRVTNHAADIPAYKDAMYYADGADLDTERTYDANGNMTSNADSRISRISYDALNMPCRIDYIDGSHIDYTYAADGVKQRVDYYLNPYTSSLPDDDLGTACDSSLLVHTWREYADNCVYICDTLSMILIDGGYITFDYTTHQPIYHYYLKDYLGNNRITVSLADGRIEEVNHYYPFGGLMGDSRNATTQPYKYIGKELDRTHGLDWYDHGARHYDPVTGRWNTMDKMCEKYYDVSPYASCGDDPVNYTDITGDTIDMKHVLILDKIYNTNVNDKINTDLSFLTGLTISTSPNGVMTYAKDNEGHPIINSVESSSAIAREQIIKLINGGNISITFSMEKNSATPHDGNWINLGFSQITSFIKNSNNVDSRTLGWGMTFLHESFHTSAGGAFQDLSIPFQTGDVVDRMNAIRQELNTVGLNMGNRESYPSISIGGIKYIPFDKSSARHLKDGDVPLRNNKYISYK